MNVKIILAPLLLSSMMDWTTTNANKSSNYELGEITETLKKIEKHLQQIEDTVKCTHLKAWENRGNYKCRGCGACLLLEGSRRLR